MATKQASKTSSKKNNSNDSEIDVQNDAELMEMPVGKRITKTIDVRAEELKRDDADETEAEETDDAGATEFFDEDLISDDFFDEEDAGVEFVEVYRLVGGSLRGGGKMPFVDNFPYTASLRGDIRDACGGGKFVVVQRGPDPETGRSRILRRKTIEIEGAPKEYSPAPAQTANPQPPIPAPPVIVQPQGDELGNFFSRMKDFGETMKALGFGKPAPQPPATPPLPPAPPPDPAQQITQTLDLYKQITSIAGGTNTGNGGGGWLDGTARVIEALGEGLGLKAIVPALVQAAVTAGLQRQPNGQPPQNGAPPQQQPTQQQMPPPQIQTPQDAIALTLAVVVQDLTANRRTGRAADCIEEQCRKFPELKQMLLPLIGAPPAELLPQLSQVAQADLSTYAHGEEWLADLQDDLAEFVEKVNAEISEKGNDMQQSVAEVSEETGAE
jgi:hypothetical protein